MASRGINGDIFMGISKGHQEEDVLPWSPHAEGISEMHLQETYRETSSLLPLPPHVPSTATGAEVLSLGANACPVNLDGVPNAAVAQRRQAVVPGAERCPTGG
jgi:hypothetical protein